MKRRIKATVRCSGRVIEVFPQKDKFIEVDRGTEWRADELDFAKDIDWKQVRIQAAIAAMQGFIGVPQTPFSHIAKEAVKLADALVAELKHSENAYTEWSRLDAINTASICENMTKIQKEIQKKKGQDE